MLTHSGITSDTGAQDFGSGWNSHLTVLQEKLAGRAVQEFLGASRAIERGGQKALEG